MSRFVHSFTLATIFPLLPILLWQGMQTRRRVPRLGEAKGAVRGCVPGSDEPFNLLLLGESTIAGVGARTHEVGLAGQTAVCLNHRLNRPVHWHALGQNGICAHEVRQQLLPRITTQPDLIVIGLGVNDVTHFSTRRQWKSEVRGLLSNLFGQWGHLPILISGLPPMHTFPALPQPLRWYLGQRARIHDAILRQVCADFPNAHYLPIPTLPSLDYFCEDGFHPSELGYAKWGEVLATAVVQNQLLLPALNVLQ